MKFNGPDAHGGLVLDVYKIGWVSSKRKPWYKRRYHRPWQCEARSQNCPFARRAMTAAGAARKMARDQVYAEYGRLTFHQRRKSLQKRFRVSHSPGFAGFKISGI